MGINHKPWSPVQKSMNGHKKDTSEFKEPPLGWYMSEKFDGYRALFKYEMIDGELVGVFYSRTGKRFMCPQWFLDSMPPPDLLGWDAMRGDVVVADAPPQGCRAAGVGTNHFLLDVPQDCLRCRAVEDPAVIGADDWRVLRARAHRGWFRVAGGGAVISS